MLCSVIAEGEQAALPGILPEALAGRERELIGHGLEAAEAAAGEAVFEGAVGLVVLFDQGDVLEEHIS
jgi:hypothetical protein